MVNVRLGRAGGESAVPNTAAADSTHDHLARFGGKRVDAPCDAEEPFVPMRKRRVGRPHEPDHLKRHAGIVMR
eukprot:CAMPEP_0174728352 /NCGR_PEP_ID=MMETSP1094-20130205/51574_1 /TAXON_ID=156173 /ORGANISM="Chrysochromulina brevifilum, Strain UTEX LB 985" /LENGTH=72 /DNA_ID=CAMNT_0015930249 /DNA_START=213 /DNA_END=431 /DNA_ORIENTATION=-